MTKIVRYWFVRTPGLALQERERWGDREWDGRGDFSQVTELKSKIYVKSWKWELDQSRSEYVPMSLNKSGNLTFHETLGLLLTCSHGVILQKTVVFGRFWHLWMPLNLTKAICCIMSLYSYRQLRWLLEKPVGRHQNWQNSKPYPNNAEKSARNSRPWSRRSKKKKDHVV